MTKTNVDEVIETNVDDDTRKTSADDVSKRTRHKASVKTIELPSLPSAVTAAVGGGILAATTSAFETARSQGSTVPTWVVLTAGGILFVSVIVVAVALELRDRAIRRRSAEIRDRARDADDDLSKAIAEAVQASDAEQRRLDEALLLSRVWQSVSARLAEYHDDAQSQGRRAFNAAMASMWVGFVATAGCGVMVIFLAATNTGAVVIGVLGAVSAALSGFVARTFLRAYESVSTQLQGYFSQPVEASRYLSAERAIHVSGLSEDARRELMMSLVAAMVAPPSRDGVST